MSHDELTLDQVAAITEPLHTAAVRVMKERDELRVQRDELLDALRAAVNGISTARRPEWDEYELVQSIRAVIARAES